MERTIVLCVEAAPPAKASDTSIRNPKQSRFILVEALRHVMAEVMADHEPFAGVSLRMEMQYWRASGRGDGLNLINGVSDIIQRRCTEEYRHDVWVIDDDANIREFHYREEPSDRDRYEVVVTIINNSLLPYPTIPQE